MNKFKKNLVKLAILVAILLVIAVFVVYKIFFSANIEVTGKSAYLYIPTGASIQNVVDSLQKNKYLKSRKTFLLAAKIKHYDKTVKAGRYKIDSAETNWHLINKLRSGKQVPVKVYVPSVRTVDKMSIIVAKKLEFSSGQLSNLLHNADFIRKYNFNTQTVPAMFIPNTYEFYWNTSAKEFVDRMKREYNKFWTENRRQKAKKIGLTLTQVSILASIVQAEQLQHPDERPRIAGLYLNRLKKGIPLQSDPTIIFAIGDFSIKRVYKDMLKTKSPYNTYLFPGLPPGPILIPDVSSIDAVLNAEKNNYLYMCAKEDLSGYHHFSTNLTQHNMYAKKYYNILNKLGIR
jgi:UPF0755 protein